MYQKPNISFFKGNSKGNKSQGSLPSDSISPKDSLNSPVDSAAPYSPSFSAHTQPTSAAPTSPSVLTENGSISPIDYQLRNDTTSPLQTAPRARNKLRRRDSQRSTPPPPPANERFGPKTGSAGRPPTRIGEEQLLGPVPSPAASPAVSAYSWQVESVKTPPPNNGGKKKRRFFSFGTSQSGPSFPSLEAAASPWPAPRLTRSSSVRSTSASDPHRSSIDGSTSRDKTPGGGAQLDSPTEDESEADRLARKIQNRHSVAFPTPNIPEGARSLIAPTAFDIPQSGSNDIRDEAAATAPGQSSLWGKAGAARTPAWERAGRAPYGRNQSSDQQQQAYQGSQQSISTVSTGARNRPEFTLSESRHTDSRPPSRQSVEPPSPSHSSIAFHHKTPSTTSFGDSMASTQQQNSVRGQESGHQASQSTSSREGQYGPTLNVNNQQGNSHRNTPQASPMAQQPSNLEQGRNTPPPSRSQNDLSQLDVQQLVQKHEELNDKYRKVKKYYFDKDAQVQQLQDSLAHQRLARSRTSLDDNEYATRFNRLDGAINNLAFNIRKDWKAVPRWLAPYVNQEATSTVSKEMTAVGRACISRWIVDEIFDRYFHPALEPNLSSHLKIIERNLRRFAPPTPTDEDKEALLTKISNWRLATLDGLQDMLSTHESVEFRSSLTNILVEMLTSDLMMNLKDPPPPGLDAGVVGIIELAINIAANLPLESRDVYVDYVMPGTQVNEQYMKTESSLPPLTNPGESAEADRASTASGDEDKDDDSQSKKKGSMFGSLMGSNKKAPGNPQRSQGEGPDQQKDQKVRFAAFMSVEVKGKNMLVKAPVYI